ncbi:MAG: HAMP domain-containing histidine kinase [Clostridiales Family XIII bacterium]|nr:HAMP domain-containing histidine kinase [Clostridiales Family XIII bacterium]
MKTKGEKKRGSGSLFRVLAVQYALFTFIVLLLFFGMARLYSMAADNILHIPFWDRSGQLMQKLADGSYEDLRSDRYLGKGAQVEVVDSEGAVAYSSRPLPETGYTAAELACIPVYGRDGYSEYRTVPDEASGRFFSVFSFFSYNDKSGQSEQQFLVVLDGDRNIVYSNLKEFPREGRATLREYALLQGNAGKDRVEKSAFTGADGQPLTALFFFPATTAGENRALEMLDRIYAPILIAGYIVIVLFFIVVLYRKVKKPIRLLSEGMHHMADGSHGEQLFYRGPAEFEAMCGSFNRMSAHLRQVELRRKDAEREKRQMLADISHDLRTPITVIQGYARGLCDGIVTPGDISRYQQAIFEKATTLATLVDTFYEYSMLSNPGFALAKRYQNLCEAAREYLAAKYSELGLSGFSLDVDIQERPLYCMLDDMQMRRVFENILTNTCKHNPPGTRLWFSVRAAEGEGMARIDIADDGAGIPEALKESLFEPFAVGDVSRAKQGSGMGLAIAKKIVEAHGGSISLEPPGGGWATHFAILLPLVPNVASQNGLIPKSNPSLNLS